MDIVFFGLETETQKKKMYKSNLLLVIQNNQIITNYDRVNFIISGMSAISFLDYGIIFWPKLRKIICDLTTYP